MKRYLAYSRQAFLTNSAFRFDTFLGITDTCLKIWMFCYIYRALYGGAGEVDGITLSMVTTNYILSIGLGTAFSMDGGYLARRIGDGSIGNELLKPVSFRGILLAADLGNICFYLLFQFLPALLLAVFTVGMQPPTALLVMPAFCLSVVLGFFVLWNLNFIVQTLSFWIINVWSILTIKNVLVNILSGSMIPLWFMPDWMQGIIQFTPFSSIYFIPAQIYLGNITGAEILFSYLRQSCWIVLLFLIGELLWRQGIKKLVIQGG